MRPVFFFLVIFFLIVTQSIHLCAKPPLLIEERVHFALKSGRSATRIVPRQQAVLVSFRIDGFI